jgi:arabinose-5-phosphate isomerase
MTAIVDESDVLLGVFTDGDLRRALDDAAVDIRNTPVSRLMGKHPKTVSAHALAVEAAQLMQEHKINALVVVDEQKRVRGALNFHDLLRARVM